MRRSPDYEPGGQRQWSRVEVAWSPQGHALTTQAPSAEYFAWQTSPKSPFLLRRVSTRTGSYGPVAVPDFVTARLVVMAIESALAGEPLTKDQRKALAARHYNEGGGLRTFFERITGSLTGGEVGTRPSKPSISVANPNRSTMPKTPVHQIRKRLLR